MLKPGTIGFRAAGVGPAHFKAGMAHVVAIDAHTVEAIEDGEAVCHPYAHDRAFAVKLTDFRTARDEAYKETREFHDKAAQQINDGYDELDSMGLHDFNLPNNYTDPEWAIGDIAYVVKVRRAWWSYLDVFKGKVIGVEWYIDPEDGDPGWRYTVYYKHPATKLDIEYGAKEGDFIEEADMLLPSDLHRTAAEAAHALSLIAREIHADYSKAYAYINSLTEADVIAAMKKEIEDDKT